MRCFHWLLIAAAFILTSGEARSQSEFTISGYVRDAASGEALIGANVYLKETLRGSATNVYGYYVLNVKPGTHTVVMSFVGYQDFVQELEVNADVKLNIEAAPKAIMAREFEVIGERGQENVDGTQMGVVDLDVQRLNTLPILLGEVDVLKTIQFLPGVQNNGEGNSGIYVRGGGPDQNLILLDDATVYNAAHLFGFFSVFNADAIRNIELIKGSMPAMYGGRISSVLDITMKEGNSRKFHGMGGIGLIASRLTLEGPIVKDRSSFIVSGRRTYIDVLTKPLISEDAAFAGSGYYFYDMNAKANYRISDKDRLFLSGYFGRDVFTFRGSQPGDPAFSIPWGNATLSARWNHVFGPRLFMNTTATFSDYSFQFDATQEEFGFQLFSGIRDVGIKTDLTHYLVERHQLKYGFQYIRHNYTTSTVSVNSADAEFNIDTPPRLHAHEAAIYVQDDFDVTDQFRLNAGLRLVTFHHVGPFFSYDYDELGRFQGLTNFDRGREVASYQSLEPRLSMRYLIDGNSSVKASFFRGQQFVHLASFSSITLPTDVWIPSSTNVKPQIGTQYAVGYFRDLFGDRYEASVELYHKDMENLIEYADGAQPQAGGNANYDAQLVFGTGYSRGAEFFVKKRDGRLTGWIGYTWSRTMRRFPDLNEGREFPSRWDRRHDMSLVLSYELNSRWSFGTTFVYATGQAVTLPVNRYFLEGRLVSEYTDRNSYRMIPYHRLDIAATWTSSPTRTRVDTATGEEVEVDRRWSSSWTFGIYNVYNRYNPFFIYFSNEGIPGQNSFNVSARQVTLFTIIPSVTWNFQF